MNRGNIRMKRNSCMTKYLHVHDLKINGAKTYSSIFHCHLSKVKSKITNSKRCTHQIGLMNHCKPPTPSDQATKENSVMYIYADVFLCSFLVKQMTKKNERIHRGVELFSV